jgi:monovalent cation:H+ antiporter-2, CPA2 family
MGEVSSEFISSLLVFIAFPLIGGIIAAKLKLPTLIGYIFGGIVLGNLFGSGMDSEALEQIANIGIILLLFAVGLEVNIGDIGRYKRFVLVGGLAQIILSGIVIFFVSLLFSFSFVEAVFIGFSFAFSSTALIAKALQASHEENSVKGSLVMGILVLQDLAVVPLIVIFSSLGSDFGIAQISVSLVSSFIKAGLVLFAAIYFGGRIVPVLFDRVAKLSRGLLNLLTIFLIFVGVYFFSVMGLPASIAAFVAGVMVGQTLEHYHVFAQIRPLRDLFAIFFFAFLGASIKVATVIPILPLIVIFTLFIVVLFVFLVYRFHSRTSFAIALLLAHVGEFSFVIMHLGFTRGLVSHNAYLIALTSVLLTISLTPLLIDKERGIYKYLKGLLTKYAPGLSKYIKTNLDREESGRTTRKQNHVVICGYGRVGRYIGLALKLSGISFIAIDRNIYVVERARRKKVDILYGNPADIDMLEHANVAKARAIVVVVPSKYAQRTIVRHAKELNSGIAIFSRVHREEDQLPLLNLGADLVTQPEFEASLTIVKQVLEHIGIPIEKITIQFKKLREEHEIKLNKKFKNSPPESF